MKPSEIAKIDEGIGDWFAKKGFLGREKQHAAIGKQIASDRAQASVQAQQLLRTEFLAQLKRSIEGAFNAGLIKSKAIPESLVYDSYNSFSKLLENRILNEAMSVPQFIQKYMKDLLVNYGELDRNHAAALKTLATDFSKKYISPQNEFPNDIAGKLYDLALDVKRSKPQARQQRFGQAPLPNSDVSFEYRGAVYSYTLRDKKWRDPTGKVITNDNEIDILNNEYYKYQKNAGQKQQGQQGQQQQGQGAQPSPAPITPTVTGPKNPKPTKPRQPKATKPSVPAVTTPQTSQDQNSTVNNPTYGNEIAANNLLARAQQGTTQDPSTPQTQQQLATTTKPKKIRDPKTGRYVTVKPSSATQALPAPQQSALPQAEPEVGTQSSTGGSTFQSGGTTVHKGSSEREALQQKAREKAEAERQARLNAQAGARTRLPAPRTIQ